MGAGQHFLLKPSSRLVSTMFLETAHFEPPRQKAYR